MKTFTMLMYTVISQDTVADISIPLPPPPKETFVPRSEKQQQWLHWKVNNNNINKKKEEEEEEEEEEKWNLPTVIGLVNKKNCSPSIGF